MRSQKKIKDRSFSTENRATLTHSSVAAQSKKDVLSSAGLGQPIDAEAPAGESTEQKYTIADSDIYELTSGGVVLAERQKLEYDRFQETLRYASRPDISLQQVAYWFRSLGTPEFSMSTMPQPPVLPSVPNDALKASLEAAVEPDTVAVNFLSTCLAPVFFSAEAQAFALRTGMADQEWLTVHSEYEDAELGQELVGKGFTISRAGALRDIRKAAKPSFISRFKHLLWWIVFAVIGMYLFTGKGCS